MPPCTCLPQAGLRQKQRLKNLSLNKIEYFPKKVLTNEKINQNAKA